MVTMTTEAEKDKAVTSVVPKKMSGNFHGANEDAPNILVYKKVGFFCFFFFFDVNNVLMRF